MTGIEVFQQYLNWATTATPEFLIRPYNLCSFAYSKYRTHYPSLKQAKIVSDNFSLSFGINSHSLSCGRVPYPSLKQAKILFDNFSLSFGINSAIDLRSLSLRKSRPH